MLWAYVTDTLNTIAGNTRYHLVYTRNGAEAVEIGGKFEKRWAEMAHPPKDEPEPEAEDNRSVTDFIDRIWGALEGTGGGESK